MTQKWMIGLPPELNHEQVEARIGAVLSLTEDGEGVDHWIKWAMVDKGLAEIITMLNVKYAMPTWTSCEGSVNDDVEAHIGFDNQDDAIEIWSHLNSLWNWQYAMTVKPGDAVSIDTVFISEEETLIADCQRPKYFVCFPPQLIPCLKAWLRDREPNKDVAEIKINGEPADLARLWKELAEK